MYTIRPVTNTVTTETITVKPITVIAITKLSIIIIITITFQSKLTTPLLMLPAVVHLLFEIFYRY